MKRLFFLTFFGCFSLITMAQHQHDAVVPPGPDAINTVSVNPAKATDQKAEETLLLNEEVYDFGKIPQGKPVTHIFEVTNSGKTALTIANVQASCGCTTPEWEKDKPIPAGQKAKITVGYNAAAEGVFTKLVTITYGDNQNKQITIKGEVWKTPASSAPVNSGLEDLKN
jgi:hypothetical protein